MTGINTAGYMRDNHLEVKWGHNADAMKIFRNDFGSLLPVSRLFSKIVRRAATNKLLIGSSLIMMGFAAPRVIESLFEFAWQAHFQLTYVSIRECDESTAVQQQVNDGAERSAPPVHRNKVVTSLRRKECAK